MTKINVKAGDIGETDEENEKLIAQLEKKTTRKPKVARKNTKVVVLDAPDQIKSYQETPAVVEEVVLDGNQQVVTDKKQKAAFLKAEKQAAKPKTTAKKQAKAEVQLLEKGVKTPTTGPRVVEVGGKKQTIHGYTLMTADIVWTIVQRGEEAKAKDEKLA